MPRIVVRKKVKKNRKAVKGKKYRFRIRGNNSHVVIRR